MQYDFGYNNVTTVSASDEVTGLKMLAIDIRQPSHDHTRPENYSPTFNATLLTFKDKDAVQNLITTLEGLRDA
jgi:hypothetical protein